LNVYVNVGVSGVLVDDGHSPRVRKILLQILPRQLTRLAVVNLALEREFAAVVGPGLTAATPNSLQLILFPLPVILDDVTP
jgi:hypothetical protein